MEFNYWRLPRGRRTTDMTDDLMTITMHTLGGMTGVILAEKFAEILEAKNKKPSAKLRHGYEAIAAANLDVLKRYPECTVKLLEGIAIAGAKWHSLFLKWQEEQADEE